MADFLCASASLRRDTCHEAAWRTRIHNLYPAFRGTGGRVIHFAEVAGVKTDQQLKVGDSELVLNAAGLRGRLFIKRWLGDDPVDASLKKALLGN